MVCHIDKCNIFPPWRNNAFLMKAPDVQMELNPCENNRTSVVTAEEEKIVGVLCASICT